MLQCPPIPLDAYTPMPPYTPCLYAPSVERKLTGPLASGVQSGAPVGRIMLSLPSNYNLDYCIHFFLFSLPKLINLWGKNYSIQALHLLILARPATICGHPEIYFCRSWSIHFVQNLVSCSRPSCGPGSWCWDCAARSSGNLYLRAIHFFRTYQSRTTVFRDISILAKKNAFNLAESRLSFKSRSNSKKFSLPTSSTSPQFHTH